MATELAAEAPPRPAEAPLSTVPISTMIWCSPLIASSGWVVDIFERDSLEPLCNTLAAALENSRAVAIFAYRERWVEREAIFCELCRERGLAVISCDADLLTPHTPIAQADPDVKGLLRVLRIHRET